MSKFSKLWLVVFIVVAATAGFIFAQEADTNTISNQINSTNQTNITTNLGFLDRFYGANTNKSTDADKPTSPFWSAVKLVFFTAVFAFGAYFIIKFVVAKSGLPSTPDNTLIEVILVKPLGMGNYLEIVKIGPSYYLLGVSNDGVRKIDKIEDKETLDYIELNKDKLKPKDVKFTDMLKIFPPGKKTDKLAFMKKQKDRLKKM